MGNVLADQRVAGPGIRSAIIGRTHGGAVLVAKATQEGLAGKAVGRSKAQDVPGTT
jgi:hypothetical protein